MIAYLITVYAILGIYLVLNIKHDIHMLQQNSYRIPRYIRYLRNNDIGSTWRIADVAMIFIIASRLLPMVMAVGLAAIYCLCKIGLIFRMEFKKPLVFTKRVWRIYSVSGIISLGFYLWSVFVLGFNPEEKLFYSGPVITVLILFLLTIFSWIIAIISVIILIPVEKSINKKYVNAASKILNSIPGLKVVGITGSYGKTSTKYFLERILTEKYNVVMTPGSYNTLMGVVRTVREKLKPFTNIFICEMGAKQKGDIKEICDLVHPEIGIITAVGPMHLETFKSLENIQSTKFELADALPSDGLAVVNNDFELSASRNVSNVKCIRYSIKASSELNPDMFYAVDVEYSPSGTTFKVEYQNNEPFELKTQLIGAANISNLLAAIIVAINLGLTENEIKRGVAGISQVEHRLSMKTTPMGITIIDDAFNSNPYGSKMALEVLSGFDKKGRRIIVTPGMIELGDKQDELNKEFGREISKTTDIAIIVGNYNRNSIGEGIRAQGYIEDNLYFVNNFNEAQKLLSEILTTGDTVLYENDLPDSFK